MFIEMNGFSVTLHRKYIKNINLRIKRSGEVQMSVPLKTPIDDIYRFLHDKRTWIEIHRYKILQQEQEIPLHLNTGAYVNFLGNKYLVQLHETLNNPYITLDDKQLHLFLSPKNSEADKQLCLTRWYHSQMQECLPPLFKKWESIVGVNITKVCIKHMKSRWGSCHPIKKHITLNLRLIQKPLICLEYVIVHELVHLLEASHNQRFYALMSHYLPEWKYIKQKLHDT